MDELNSIMLGGDAFITKPYNTAILLAKIAALLRRVYASEQSEILTWNDATLHLESSMIEYKGQKAELTKNELKILYYLFKSAGKICSRNDMVDFLWDNQLYIDDNALSVNITRIRNKLDYIGLHDFIKTKHRQGSATSCLHGRMFTTPPTTMNAAPFCSSSSRRFASEKTMRSRLR